MNRRTNFDIKLQQKWNPLYNTPDALKQAALNETSFVLEPFSDNDLIRSNFDCKMNKQWNTASNVPGVTTNLSNTERSSDVGITQVVEPMMPLSNNRSNFDCKMGLQWNNVANRRIFTEGNNMEALPGVSNQINGIVRSNFDCKMGNLFNQQTVNTINTENISSKNRVGISQIPTKCIDRPQPTKCIDRPQPTKESYVDNACGGGACGSYVTGNKCTSCNIGSCGQGTSRSNFLSFNDTDNPWSYTSMITCAPCSKQMPFSECPCSSFPQVIPSCQGNFQIIKPYVTNDFDGDWFTKPETGSCRSCGN